PAPTVNDTTHVKTVNLIVFTAYLAIAFPVGGMLARRSIRPIRAWLVAGRAPTAAERDYAVRAPLRQAVTFGALWAGAALVFFVLNAQYSLGLATEVGVSILLGGVVTSALGYLLLERINRGQTVLALAIGAPERPSAAWRWAATCARARCSSSTSSARPRSPHHGARRRWSRSSTRSSRSSSTRCARTAAGSTSSRATRPCACSALPSTSTTPPAARCAPRAPCATVSPPSCPRCRRASASRRAPWSPATSGPRSASST